jgi:hypothetical protein
MGSLAIFDGPAASHDEFRRLVRERLALIQRHRQKVQRVPFRVVRPVWIDDQHVDIDRFQVESALHLATTQGGRRVCPTYWLGPA